MKHQEFCHSMKYNCFPTWLLKWKQILLFLTLTSHGCSRLLVVSTVLGTLRTARQSVTSSRDSAGHSVPCSASDLTGLMHLPMHHCQRAAMETTSSEIRMTLCGDSNCVICSVLILMIIAIYIMQYNLFLRWFVCSTHLPLQSGTSRVQQITLAYHTFTFLGE